ncbi:uncharacterized protein LOC122650745 [Telopea speciosissima]|uniref:uncharacterized protein LOC122650745 n=1 Tax=Telopea speciosissima TaxID=54955 RepID=UPI001CC3F0AC|nr:uncharacterized protein LOC122650745 [Telopea speciosissima]
MAFSSWFSRFRSSSRNIYRTIESSSVYHFRTQRTYIPETLYSEGTKPVLSWSSSLIPLAVALSAGSIVFDIGRNPSMCDASGVNDYRGGTVGGKDSTDLVVKGSRKEVAQELIDELKAICGGNMTLDYDERYFHGKPQNSFHTAVNVPDIVVFPRSEDEVSKIVRSCNNHKVPIVPYGGATSLEGHTLSPHGGVCIDMSLMKNVKVLHLEDMDVVVEPGIGWMELNEYLESYGLFFPLDPEVSTVATGQTTAQGNHHDYPSFPVSPVKLDGTNYLLWSTSVFLSIDARGYKGYIYGTTVKPSEAGSLQDKWSSSNSLGELTLSEYHCELRSLWQELDYYDNFQLDCLSDITKFQLREDKFRVYTFLTGLNVEYDQLRSQVLSRSPFPTLEQAYSLIQLEDTRRSTMLPTTQPERSALISSGGGSSNTGTRSSFEKEPLKCTHCGKERHTVDYCWKLHGRPSDSSDGGGGSRG